MTDAIASIAHYAAEGVVDSRNLLQIAIKHQTGPEFKNRDFVVRALLRAALVFAWFGFDALVKRNTKPPQEATAWVVQSNDAFSRETTEKNLVPQFTRRKSFSGFTDAEKLSISHVMRNKIVHPDEFHPDFRQLLYGKLQTDVITETLRIMEKIARREGWPADYFSNPLPWTIA